MKKLIFILIMALLASSNVTWGQLPVTPPQLLNAPTYCVPATPIVATCVPSAGPTNPIPGTLYTYTVNVTGGGTSPTIHWFVTTDLDFINAGVLNLTDVQTVPTSPYLIATGVTYNLPANIIPSVEITWQAIPTTDDVFLVTYVTNEAGCTDNIKVYKIETAHVFTLDIDALTTTGAQNLTKLDCVSPVQGALYNSTSGEVEMDYGVNYLYYIVNAANWANSWLPRFEVTLTPALTASMVLAVDWAYPDQSFGAAVWHACPGGPGVFTSTDAVTPHTAPIGPGVGAAGECIVVRLTVDHNQNEALANILVDFAVDGTMYDQVGPSFYDDPLFADIHYDEGPSGVPPCPWYDGFTNDIVQDYTLSLRPTVTDVTPPAPPYFLPTDSE